MKRASTLHTKIKKGPGGEPWTCN